ncbi:MAG: hypothetical protein V1754_11960 [Pseudomonadota bacterium]
MMGNTRTRVILVAVLLLCGTSCVSKSDPPNEKPPLPTLDELNKAFLKGLEGPLNVPADKFKALFQTPTELEEPLISFAAWASWADAKKAWEKYDDSECTPENHFTFTHPAGEPQEWLDFAKKAACFALDHWDKTYPDVSLKKATEKFPFDLYIAPSSDPYIADLVAYAHPCWNLGIDGVTRNTRERCRYRLGLPAHDIVFNHPADSFPRYGDPQWQEAWAAITAHEMAHIGHVYLQRSPQEGEILVSWFRSGHAWQKEGFATATEARTPSAVAYTKFAKGSVCPFGILNQGITSWTTTATDNGGFLPYSAGPIVDQFTFHGENDDPSWLLWWLRTGLSDDPAFRLIGLMSGTEESTVINIQPFQNTYAKTLLDLYVPNQNLRTAGCADERCIGLVNTANEASGQVVKMNLVDDLPFSHAITVPLFSTKPVRLIMQQPPNATDKDLTLVFSLNADKTPQNIRGIVWGIKIGGGNDYFTCVNNATNDPSKPSDEQMQSVRGCAQNNVLPLGVLEQSTGHTFEITLDPSTSALLKTPNTCSIVVILTNILAKDSMNTASVDVPINVTLKITKKEDPDAGVPDVNPVDTHKPTQDTDPPKQFVQYNGTRYTFGYEEGDPSQDPPIPCTAWWNEETVKIQFNWCFEPECPTVLANAKTQCSQACVTSGEGFCPATIDLDQLNDSFLPNCNDCNNMVLKTAPFQDEIVLVSEKNPCPEPECCHGTCPPPP